MFRRETIIALRARHEAYRIATEILYPPVDVPPPLQPAMPIDPPDSSPRSRALDVTGVIAVTLTWAIVLVYWFLYWLVGGR